MAEWPRKWPFVRRRDDENRVENTDRSKASRYVALLSLPSSCDVGVLRELS